MTEATGFGVTKTDSVVRYYRNGEFKYNKPGEIIYCLHTNNGYFMDAFDTEEEAKEKLKEVMYAVAGGAESFEF